MKTFIKSHKSAFFGTAIAVCILAVAVLIAASYLLSPSALVCLDVNPSIELETNRLDKVVSITPINEDATAMLAGYDPKGRDLDSVIEALVNRMILNGYLGRGVNNDVLITVKDDQASQQVLDRVNNQISTYLGSYQIESNVYTQVAPLEDKIVRTAHDAGVSAGKMNLVKDIFPETGLSVQDLVDMKVSELLDYARANNIPLDLMGDRLNNVALSQSNQSMATPNERSSSSSNTNRQPSDGAKASENTKTSTPSRSSGNTRAASSSSSSRGQDIGEDSFDQGDDEWDNRSSRNQSNSRYDDGDDKWDNRSSHNQSNSRYDDGEDHFDEGDDEWDNRSSRNQSNSRYDDGEDHFDEGDDEWDDGED